MAYTERQPSCMPGNTKGLGMAQSYFGSVWFATKARHNSRSKWFVFDDRGALQLTPSGLSFSGRKRPVTISHIRRVSLTRQQMPWISYLVVAAVLLLYFSILSALTQFPFWILLVLMIIVFLYGLLIGYNTRWVEVEYSVRQDEPNWAYFADASRFGWGGLFGGARRLYEVIAAQHYEQQPALVEPVPGRG